MASFLLLILIQPGESFVFPFTTGIVGLGIGIALLILKGSFLKLVAY